MNLTSAEWFDLRSGEWKTLPSLIQGRRLETLVQYLGYKVRNPSLI